MIARFLTSRNSKDNYSLNIGEVQDDNTLPIWCEDEFDTQTYVDIHITKGDIDQLIFILNKRKEEILIMEE
jgi:hypothetical protein